MSNPLLSAPILTWHENGQPVSTEFHDPYFSIDDGLNESRHVFIRHNRLVERWQQWPWQQNPCFCLVETGFGTGLNFLATWQEWQKQPLQQGWLHFTSIEKHPLTAAQLAQALANWPELAPLATQLLADYPLPLKGMHYLSWPQERLSLSLYFGDIQDALPALSGPVHAWYLDGFAPARNPQMWPPELFMRMRQLSQIHPTQPPSFATYTAAREVRLGLMGAGFAVHKTKGFGRKRDMLCGHFDYSQGPEQPAIFHHKPWLLPQPANSAATVVIGAGLAGASTARALAERGVEVTVLDGAGIAQGGSGNPQGGLYIKLAASDSAIHTSFYLAAYQYALSYLKRHLGPSHAANPYWQQCGMLQLAYDEKEAQRQTHFAQLNPLPAALVSAHNATAISQHAGLTLPLSGLCFPQGGWVNPVALCERLLAHPNIHFKPYHVHALSAEQNGWRLHTDQGEISAAQLVLANAYHATQLLPELKLPLKQIRGQLSYLKAELTPNLEAVISGRNYLAPAQNGQLCLGATFDTGDTDTALRDADHLRNLEYLSDYGPLWQQVKEQGLQAIKGGRVGFRASAPDYLPMLGSMPEPAAFVQDFAKLAKDARHIPIKTMQRLPNLWLNLGHGSKGIASTPLCAEILASLICGSAVPVTTEMQESLWAGRFVVKGLMRGST